MRFGFVLPSGANEVSFLILVAIVAAGASLAVVLGFFYWFRRDQRRLQRKILQAISQNSRSPADLSGGGGDPAMAGELVAQFRVRQGKQVVSVLEADGKRFIHIDGNLSESERAKMMRYLKSEGFMS